MEQVGSDILGLIVVEVQFHKFSATKCMNDTRAAFRLRECIANVDVNVWGRMGHSGTDCEREHLKTTFAVCC